jgi:hypothetical protein
VNTQRFYIVFSIFFNIKTLANFLDGILLRQALQVEGLQLEHVFPDGYGLEGLLGLLFQFEYEFGRKEFGQYVVDKGRECDLEDFHLFHVFLLEV